MTRAILSVVAMIMAAGLGVALAADEGKAPASAPTATAPAAKAVNTVCPIEGGKVDPAKVPAELTREFKGQKVGFCCPDCLPVWDKLSDAEKEAKLAAVVKPAASKVVNVTCPIKGNAIDPEKVPAGLTRQFKGETVGFCCPGCPAAWDKLSDAEKEAKLAAARPQPPKPEK
jgi:hypothetical protein